MPFVVDGYLRRLLVLAVTCLVCLTGLSGVPASAQNNPYGIDDACYEQFKVAERKIGSIDFASSCNDLMSLSVKSSDRKSMTLAYVLKLRDAIQRQDSDDVDEALSGLLVTAESSELSQYYYHGYVLASSYYNNIGMITKSLALAQEMETISKQNGDVYGRWSSDRCLASLYIARHNYKAAREYLLEAIDIYRSTEDPSVRSQSLASVYADLAGTYDFGNDSLKMYAGLSYEAAEHSADTLRYNILMTQLSAYDGDITSYRMYRDNSKNSPVVSSLNPGAFHLFDCIDYALSGDMDTAYEMSADLDDSVLKLLQAMSRKKGDYFNADRFGYRITEILQKLNYSEYSERLAEIGARIGNDKLNRDLLSKSQQLNRLLIMMFIILFIFAVSLGAFFWIYTKNLSRERDKAESANRMKTNFVQNMRHEIRTPLNAVVGFSQLLSLPGDVLSDEEKQEYGKYILNNSDILTMLIDDILSLSDVDNGSFQISMDQCDCNAICRSVIASIQSMVPAGVECTMTTDAPDNLLLMSDERRIQQVLVNYLTNACKYTTSGSIVLDCSVTSVPGKVVFSVTDTGIGIPAGDAEKIFTRFAKLDQYKQGSGLGLSICRVIARKLGGEVQLDRTYGRCSSEEKSGSRFLFILPR